MVAVGGDSVELRDGVPSINGVPLAQKRERGRLSDGGRRGEGGGAEPIACKLVRENNNGRSYTIMFEEGRPARISRGRSSRRASYSSSATTATTATTRASGAPFRRRVKGMATVIWWSRDAAGVRWSRIGHGVE